MSLQLNEQSNKQEAVNTAATADKDITTETLKHLRMRSWGLEDTLPVPLVHIEDISLSIPSCNGENVGGGVCNYYYPA